MIACPNCGQENPDGFRLCGMCGAALASEPVVPREERKVVTVVFCDLVGFTARAERLDPEEVRGVLRPYHERVRSELERRGGTVEKFIGDAVMALFGAPTAHEDDPERAVRAALAIRDFALEEQLELRIGITTGEALVSLGASPAEGEGMASGDVVNTAARLQSAAPVNGVLVDESTFRATRSAVEFTAAAPVAAKGKSEPVAVWQATNVRSRFGADATHHARTELVGRERELGLLREAFERARQERTPQLVTLVAVPGMGKSRLVHELSRIVDADPELVTWRQGRCLAYGDGVAFWALADIVKAQAGLLEQDTEQDASHKLRASVRDALTDAQDARWVEAHLRPLVGLESATALGGDRRNESFAAWRRYLEALAEQRPLVLVLEDLHWADDGLLDFVDELVDWLSGVPVLVVCTARPELLERRPGWGGGKVDAATIGLSPLSPEQTSLLLARVLERSVLSAATQQSLLERAGGNPLYAEQFAQLYLERGSADELPLPETLQGLVAARIDGLSPEEKSVLQDAAVVGKVFWTGSLPHDRSGAEGLSRLLHGLERKGFLTRQRRSSLVDESEWSFAHMLLRDVAYGQIPRASRADRHRQTAEWIESVGRSEDHAELLVFHWRSALELARATGGDTSALVEPTRRALRAAGDRAFALSSFAAAAGHYEEALDLWPGDSERPYVLFRRAVSLVYTADESRIEALEEARDALVALDNRQGAAEAEAFLAQVSWYQGRHDDVSAHLSAAEALVEGTGASPAATRVLAVSARYRMLAGASLDGLRLATEALAAAEELGLDELRAHALVTIGSAKYALGEPGAEDALEAALEIALAARSPQAATALNNLSVFASTVDVRRSHALELEAAGVAERMGDREVLRFVRGNLILSNWQLGRWDESMSAADEFVAACESGSPHYMEAYIRNARAAMRLACGDVDGALVDCRRALELARADPETLGQIESWCMSAIVLVQVGQTDAARELAAKVAAALQHWEGSPLRVRLQMEVLAPLADELGIGEEMRRLVDAALPGRFRDAAAAALRGDFRLEADCHAEAGFVSGEADARLRAATRLIETGETAAGEAELEKALAFYRSVGATLAIERCEALMREAEAV